MSITAEILEEFKERMHITHSSEDDNLKRLLSFSVSAIKQSCGDFDIKENERAKELVFERSRYAYNDALEYFNDNFLSELNSLGLSIAIAEAASEGDPDATI